MASFGDFEKGLGMVDGGGSGDWSSEVVSKPEEVDEESRTRSFYFRQVLKLVSPSMSDEYSSGLQILRIH